MTWQSLKQRYYLINNLMNTVMTGLNVSIVAIVPNWGGPEQSFHPGLFSASVPQRYTFVHSYLVMKQITRCDGLMGERKCAQ